ncbi:hypothetical protein RMSM_04251 [Rhodopirellula maiorica SM1]|uniref:Uncharacterized protein n=1 Tax=Rhodopirellula maiorica SM1 TaxID=1265738 RepID=M5RHR3_9BACT|nr:hypothetical protein [Rhodopirellula maiorica]EMI18825.1 hypothetical protein RMSM_04251 [Rhodopirellula maiorica SM1]
MAKPKKQKSDQNKLSERINLRVTEKELALLEKVSELDDRTLSNWARRVLVREARRQMAKKEESSS